MKTWIDTHPDRFAYEVAQLEELGFTTDRFELRGNRRLVMRGSIESVRGRVELAVAYPDTFPYLRPEVYAPGLRLDRHQNVYEGNLCLLDRSTAQWQVSDTGAWLVADRVPFLLDLLAGDPARMERNETPQGEPRSAYFRSQPGTAVFVPEAANAISEDERSGLMELSLGRAEPRGKYLRALLKRVTAKGGRHGRLLASADEPLERRFPSGEIEGPWVRLDELPADNTPEALLAMAAALSPAAAKAKYQQLGSAQLAVTGFVFSEEVRQGSYEDGWMFVVRHREMTGAHSLREGAYIVRGQRLSPGDLAERTPQLRNLRDKHVTVIGLGGVGSFIATDLARAGVGELTIVDGDAVEAGNTVRWPVGLTAIGHRKADVIAGWIVNEHPYTAVHKIDGRLGDSRPLSAEGTRGLSELDVLAKIFERSHLVIDATAELGIQHLVADLAADRPQLHVWATEGAAGGVIALVDGSGGCWLCLQHALEDGTIPLPPADLQATIQPRGCASPTFTGAAFDLAPVSNQAVRMAVAALLGHGGDADVCVMSLRDDKGAPLPVPSWATYPLTRSVGCDACRSARAA